MVSTRNGNLTAFTSHLVDFKSILTAFILSYLNIIYSRRHTHFTTSDRRYILRALVHERKNKQQYFLCILYIFTLVTFTHMITVTFPLGITVYIRCLSYIYMATLAVHMLPLLFTSHYDYILHFRLAHGLYKLSHVLYEHSHAFSSAPRHSTFHNSISHCKYTHGL